MSQIRSDKILYSVGKNDECYTPDYGVKPILEFIWKQNLNNLKEIFEK